MSSIPFQSIVIIGPTASGKSDLAIRLARCFRGEIISADSRQVYRGMDVGSGKVTKNEQRLAKHWLLDIASPKRSYNVTHFIRDAKKIIASVKRRGKVPIICGGTGFWIQALIEDSLFPAVKPDKQLRKKLGKLSAEELFTMLQKKDPARSKTIDVKNKVRLIRALEICQVLGRVPVLKQNNKLGTRDQDILILGLNPAKEILQKNIKIRLKKRFKIGMMAEVKRLQKDGVSWKRLESFGLEYKYVSLFLQKKITRETMQENLEREIWRYAKRQLSFLRRFEKRGARIHWVASSAEALHIVAKEKA